MRPLSTKKWLFSWKSLRNHKWWEKQRKSSVFFKSARNHKVVHHLKISFWKVQKSHDFSWKSLRNQKTVTKQMKSKRFLKTSGKTMKNEYFWSNFERNDIDSFKWSKENIYQKRTKSRSKWNKMKLEKCIENTRALTLSDDQKRKIRIIQNHKIIERTHSSWILPKIQEQWLFWKNERQKKKEMNQMHKIDEIFWKKKPKKPLFQGKNARASPVT